MVDFLKISRGGGVFSKNFQPGGGIPKIPPTPYSRCLVETERFFYKYIY